MERKIEKICFKKSSINSGNLTKTSKAKVSFLHGYTESVSIQHLLFLTKKKKKTDNASLTENIDVQDENSDEKETQLEFFYKAVHELNPVEKALIFLFLEGQSHKEIATNLGITEVNARVKLNRTKEKLQQIIKKYGYEF